MCKSPTDCIWMILVLLCATATQAAPAPRPKSPISVVSGEYSLEFVGRRATNVYTARFSANGYYACRYQGSIWAHGWVAANFVTALEEGTWSWDARARVLHCSTVSSTGAIDKWAAKFDMDLTGYTLTIPPGKPCQVRLRPKK